MTTNSAPWNSLLPVFFLILIAGLPVLTNARAEVPQYGPAMNYMMHCQGCHMADGAGQGQFVPSFRDNVSRFLVTEAGRTYLARVPGIAQSLLSDQERAAVLNWIVKTFDAEHIPSKFEPYTASELAEWRYNALSQPTVVRAQLISQFDSGSETIVTASARITVDKPPAAFAICSACHTVSNEGSNGMGPNLRGVVGRIAGTTSGFTYSTAISSAGITWTVEKLDAFLKAPAETIPGNLMVFAGIQDASDRKAIIDYLISLGRTGSIAP